MNAAADANQNVETVTTYGPVFVDQTLHLGPCRLTRWAATSGSSSLRAVPLHRPQPERRGGEQPLRLRVRGRRHHNFDVGHTEERAGDRHRCDDRAAYRDSLGGRNNLAANAPRSTWLSGRRELVTEAPIANRTLFCRDLTNAAWTASGVTAAMDQTGLHGAANSASRLTATAANGTRLQAITDATSRSRIASFDLARRVGTGALQFTYDNGATWQTITIKVPASGTARVTVPSVASSTPPTIGFRIATSGDSFRRQCLHNGVPSFELV